MRPVTDERVRATVLAIADELTDDGNFPRAFSHLALINAVMHVIDGDERLSTGGPPGTGLEAGAGAAVDEAGP
jgi:GH15 family glucan-1,4-alpha-glucosidase